MLLRPKIPKGEIPDKMPFGKHKGKLFSKIPSNYLAWLTEQEWVHQSLQEAIEQETLKRDRDQTHWNE